MTVAAEAAVGRSITHNERAKLRDASPADVAYLKRASEDWAVENDGSLDIWGTRDGEEWRVRACPSGGRGSTGDALTRALKGK